MTEPGNAPPIPDGPVGGIYDGAKEADPGEELGSASFWNSLSELSIAGMTVTPGQARKIIYAIGAILLLLGALLVSHLLSPPSGSGATSAAARPPPPSSTAGSSVAQPAPAPAPVPSPALQIAPITFRAKLRADDAEFGDGRFMVHGSECSLSVPSPSACGGVVEGRCGMSPAGELYAWLGVTCNGDLPCGGGRRGPAVTHGCSGTSVETDGTFVECCYATTAAVKTPGNCPAATPSCYQDDGRDGR